MVVEEVQVAPRQPRDLRERFVHALRVKGLPALEETVLVAERAVMRAAARDHDGVGNEIEAPPDQVPSDGRDPLDGPHRRRVSRSRRARGQVLEELREGVLTGAKEEGVGVGRRLLGQRGRMQSAEDHVGTPGSIVIGDPVRPVGVRDVHLNHDEVWMVFQIELLHVLVHDADIEAGVEVGGEGGETEGREERVLDWTPIGTRRLGEGGQDEFHAPDGPDAQRVPPYSTRCVPFAPCVGDQPHFQGVRDSAAFLEQAPCPERGRVSRAA